MLNYERGSEWRRWDLHIHTPGTLKNDQYEGKTIEEKWDNFYDTILIILAMVQIHLGRLK